MTLTAVQPRTFLQLVGDLWRECGCSGGAPASTANQTGEAFRLVNWVHDAELEIQNLWVDWKFLRKTLTFYSGTQNQTGIFTALNGATSAFPLDIAEWDYNTFFIYPAGSTQPQPLQVVEWQEVRGEVFDVVDFSQPWRVIVMPDNTLRFDLIPDQSYQFTAEYRTVPYDLKVDADISVIPTRFANRLIIEWGRMKYGNYENAAEQVQAARNAIYGTVNDQGIMTTPGILAALENDQLPNNKNSRLQQGNNIVIGGGYGSDGNYGYPGY